MGSPASNDITSLPVAGRSPDTTRLEKCNRPEWNVCCPQPGARFDPREFEPLEATRLGGRNRHSGTHDPARQAIPQDVMNCES